MSYRLETWFRGVRQMCKVMVGEAEARNLYFQVRRGARRRELFPPVDEIYLFDSGGLVLAWIRRDQYYGSTAASPRAH